MTRFVPAALAALMLALPAAALFAAPAVTEKTDNGAILATPSGMSLYTFDKDSGGKSACTGGCASFWPPFLAKSGAKAEGDYGLLARGGGDMQWTYKGHPLYTFAQDIKPKQAKGDGFKGVWHLARP